MILLLLLLLQLLYDSVQEEDFIGMMKAFAFGADVNWVNVNAENKTPVHLACELNKFVCVEYLVQNNAKLNVTDSNGRTPSELATVKHSKEVLDLLTRKADKS